MSGSKYEQIMSELHEAMRPLAEAIAKQLVADEDRTADDEANSPRPVEPVPAGALPLVGMNIAGLGNNPQVDPVTPAIAGTHYRKPERKLLAPYVEHLQGRPWIARLPTVGERWVAGNGQPLREGYLAEVREAFDLIHEYNGKVVLDNHAYGRWHKKVATPVAGLANSIFNGQTVLQTVIGTPESPMSVAGVANMWQRIAAEFKSHPALLGYDVMNEPNGNANGGADTKGLWFAIAQAAIDKIRQVDKIHPIIISGYGWSTAKFWRAESDYLKELVDPANNLIFQAHQYPDTDPSANLNHPNVYGAGGGKWIRPQPFGDSIDPQARAGDWDDWILWLREYGFRGYAGEFGGPADVQGMTEYLEILMDKFIANDIPFTQWLSGPGFAANYANGMNTPEGTLKANAEPLLQRLGTVTAGYGPTPL